jgi:arsenate reductase-like glutaredoxin family protein
MENKIEKILNKYSMKHQQLQAVDDDIIIEASDFKNIAEEIVKLFAIPVVVGQSEQLACGDCEPMEYDVDGIRYFKCRKCGLPMK